MGRRPPSPLTSHLDACGWGGRSRPAYCAQRAPLAAPQDSIVLRCMPNRSASTADRTPDIGSSGLGGLGV